MPFDPEENRRKSERTKDACANFTRDIVINDLGIALAYTNAVTIYKYEMTADDVVEMVIIGNKYDMKGKVVLGPHPGRSDDHLYTLVEFRYDGS